MNVIRFIEQVKVEFNKITWPSWSETKITTILVLIVALIMSVYFVIVDQIIVRILKFILG